MPRRLVTPLLVAAIGALAGCSRVPEVRCRFAQRYVPMPWEAQASEASGAERFGVRTDGAASRPVAVARGASSALRWSVEPPPGARLLFGYAAAAGEDPPASLRLSITWTREGEPPVPLWARELSGDELDDAPHFEALDLQVAGRGELVLGFEAGEAEAQVSWIGATLLGPPTGTQLNLIIVCVDTLRADRLEAFGGDRSAMPLLDERLRGAVRFERAYTNSPWSLPSMATIFTGRLPSTHHAGRRSDLGAAGVDSDWNARPVDGGIELVIAGRVYKFQTLHDSVPTLNEVLGARGYSTAAIHANGYINPPTRALKGADRATYYDSLDAAAGTDLAIESVEDLRAEPFFLFLHYIDPHQWRMRLREGLRDRDLDAFDADEREEVLATYDELCAYTDRHVDRFFAHLDASGLLEESLVFFVSDHGERFFEGGVVGSHGGCQLESVLRIPFAMWIPGRAPASVGTRVSLVDVAPTAYEHLGLLPPAGLDGASLLPLLDGQEERHRRVLAEFVLWSAEESAVLEDRWKLVRGTKAPDRLYDIFEDPREAQDLAAREPARVARLGSLLDVHRERGLALFQALTFGATQLDEATLRSLQELGYVGGR